MLIAYGKKIGDTIYIYEKGTTYIGMEERKVNRMFKDLNNDPLTFDDEQSACDWCNARNDIMGTSFI